MIAILALALLLPLLLLGCEQLQEWSARPEPAPADCPEPPPCPACPTCPTCPSPDQDQGPGVSGSLLEPSFKEETLVGLINDYRQGQGLPPLEWDARLYIAAAFHAQVWAQACRTKEGCSDKCWENEQCPYELSFPERLKLAGYTGTAQELLAAGDGYYDSQDVLADWTDREWYPAAHAALSSPSYNEVACSFVRCHYCWVHTIYVCLLGGADS
jgi:hypothetical protein